MIETFFVHRLDLLRPTLVEDSYGDTVPGWPTSATSKVKGWVSQKSEDENRSNRTAEIGDWIAYLPADTVIDGTYRVRWADPTFGVTRLFQVIGPPTPAHTPSGPHHIEISLREVSG